MTYRISGTDAAVFEVTPETGRVTMKGSLDRENKRSLAFTAHVSDGHNEGKGSMNIIVLDVNDERPEFLDPSYDKSVPENTPTGELLFKVSATDDDEGDAGAVRYKIDDVTPKHGFEMFSIGQFNGEVKLTGRLNYTSLSTFYRLKINASDGGGSCGSGPFAVQSNSVFSYITVEDVADLDPLFINTPYTQSVEENSAVDISVFKVSAIDQDKGINDDMIYTIEDSKPPGLFKMSQNDGVISVSSVIDREVTGDTVTLTLKATEVNVNIHGIHASTTTTMKVTILDVNDNPPEFYECV
ncbi:cadherin-related family member 2, partial [Nematolebias whitei]|uniref:cadherin-related family member 2 n=1 Tax=Nematolebias whitei TaxID=451745 RepID=UPI001899D00E